MKAAVVEIDTSHDTKNALVEADERAQCCE